MIFTTIIADVSISHAVISNRKFPDLKAIPLYVLTSVFQLFFLYQHMHRLSLSNVSRMLHSAFLLRERTKYASNDIYPSLCAIARPA